MPREAVSPSLKNREYDKELLRRIEDLIRSFQKQTEDAQGGRVGITP